jgi:hypothetical protein
MELVCCTDIPTSWNVHGRFQIVLEVDLRGIIRILSHWSMYHLHWNSEMHWLIQDPKLGTKRNLQIKGISS